MIVYQLTCATGHGFEGWYASAETYDRQRHAGRVECPVCATKDVRKLPSAPYVHTSAPSVPAAARVAAPDGERHQALAQLRTMILANTENVGRRFPEVARRIHYGEEAHRGIRGQVTPQEAAELHEEGVPTLSVSPDIQLNDDVTH
jgi:hypothetical protein